MQIKYALPAFPRRKKINRHGKMAVGVLEKSFESMTPPVFGRNAPCCITDGTPTHESGIRDHRRAMYRVSYTKNDAPLRRILCADSVHVFLYRFRTRLFYGPETTSLWIQKYYKIKKAKTQVTYINKSLVALGAVANTHRRWRDFYIVMRSIICC